MKKTVTIILSSVLLFCAAAFAAAAFWTLRPETHRPALERALGEAFEAQASIRKISWIWANGAPGLELRSVVLRTAEAGPDSDAGQAFWADRIRLTLDLPALFRRQVRILSIRLESPRMRILRTERGLQSAGLPLEPGRWGGLKNDDSAMSWGIEQIGIRSGTLVYEDATGGKNRLLELRSLDLKTRPPSKRSPILFEGKAGFLTPLPNMLFEGSFRRHAGRSDWTAALTKVRLGLERISVRTLERALPELGGLGLRGRFAGALSGAIDRIEHDGKRLRDLEGNLKLEGAKFFVRAFKSPLTDLNLDVHFDRDTVVVSSLSGRIAGGEFSGRGEVRNLDRPDPDAVFRFRAERIRLSDLFPRPTSGRPQLVGRASFEIEGRVQGRASGDWLAKLEGKGAVALADGVLVNVNLLKLIFDKLAVSLPGAADAFARSMPQDLARKLAVPDTALAPAEIPFMIGNGGAVYPAFRIAGDGFEINGSGQQGFGGDIYLRTVITLDPGVSAYLIHCFPDIAAIADAYGRLSLPVLLTGTIRNVRVQPDTQYLIGRIFGVKSAEYLKKLI